VVCIAISQAAFDAIASTLPPGSTGYENAVNEKGERLIWLDRSVVDRLRSLRGPGESYSDVILRLAGGLEGEALDLHDQQAVRVPHSPSAN
jgi:hypothetical protein